MTFAYFDCFSGISGDMILGALVDAGLSLDDLRAEVAKLGLRGYELKAEKVMRAGIAGTRVRVVLEDTTHQERHLEDILKIIDGSDLGTPAKEKAGRIFHCLAEAEATVHGTTPDRIHFHEVGAMDAIIDIVGAVAGLELLGIGTIMASAINVGSGTVQTAHGLLPVPAPATAELLKNVPFYQSTVPFELATPTGAAVVSTLGEGFGSMPQMRIERVAYGAGDRDVSGAPNVLRIMIGERAASYDEDTSVVIETNIDDMNPQVYDYVVEKLLRGGAQDAFLTPVIMKKGRPGVLLSVLCDRGNSDKVLDIVFRETTTIGVRIGEVKRRKLSREIRDVNTRYGKVRIKLSKRGEEVLTATPEYEDCRRIAEEQNVPLKKVIDEARDRSKDF